VPKEKNRTPPPFTVLFTESVYRSVLIRPFKQGWQLLTSKKSSNQGQKSLQIFKKSAIQKICARVATGVRTTPFTLSATLALLTNNYQLSYDE
jgi:hypothetical protein